MRNGESTGQCRNGRVWCHMDDGHGGTLGGLLCVLPVEVVLAEVVPTTPGVALVSQRGEMLELSCKLHMPGQNIKSTSTVHTGRGGPLRLRSVACSLIAAMLPSLLRRAVVQGAFTAPAVASALQPRFAASLAVQQSAG
jgi:hypothetical protein